MQYIYITRCVYIYIYIYTLYIFVIYIYKYYIYIYIMITYVCVAWVRIWLNPTPPAQSRGLTTAWLLEEQPLPVSRAGAPVMCRLKPGDHRGPRGPWRFPGKWSFFRRKYGNIRENPQVVDIYDGLAFGMVVSFLFVMLNYQRAGKSGREHEISEVSIHSIWEKRIRKRAVKSWKITDTITSNHRWKSLAHSMTNHRYHRKNKTYSC